MDLENKDSSCADGQVEHTFSQNEEINEQKTQDKGLDTFDEDYSNIDSFKKNETVIADEADNELYQEVLEKLDIKTKLEGKKNISASDNTSFQKNQNIQAQIGIENAVKNDFSKIHKMVNAGLINPQVGQNLQRQVLKKAFDSLVQMEKIKRANSQSHPSEQVSIGENALENFKTQNPSFFEQNGRKEVYEFLKAGGAAFGKDELNKISDIVRLVEKSAIDRYLQKMSHEKSLINSNEAAKKRLTANAQKSNAAGNLSRTFTREQIGKMTGAEFTKYEPIIMEQLKKGLIK